MLESFKHYIEENELAQEGQKLLLAISGGIDSMVMMHLFNELGNFPFAIVHCNFQLRGEESDKDQNFVRNMAEQNYKEFYTINFDTKQFALKNRISIQMAARELRYKWFLKLAKAHQFDRIAIAHNQDDIAETMIINLVRGTGIKGLTGIKPISGVTIRPLLFASRLEIENYAEQHAINFREDSSNAEVKYKRNLIRHKIMPLLQELNPSIRQTLSQETEIFSAAWNIYQRKIDSIKKVSFSKKGGRYLVDIHKLIKLKINSPLLYDVLSAFEFSYPVVKDIINSLNTEPGRRFYSTKYVLLKDREYLIIEKIDESSIEQTYEIREDLTEINFPVQLSINKFHRNNDFTYPKTASTASLDMDTLKFPLTLRHWQEGDFFYPLGMEGKKKLSDFFTDIKLDLLGKKRIWLLTSENEIVWILGHRIDNRFKITPQSQNIMQIEIID